MTFEPDLARLLERLAAQPPPPPEPAPLPPDPARTPEPPPARTAARPPDARPPPPAVLETPAAPPTPRPLPEATPRPPADAPRLTEEQWKRATTSALLQPTDTPRPPETPKQVLAPPTPHEVPAFPMKRLHDDGTTHERPADVPTLPGPSGGRRGPVGSATGDDTAGADSFDALALIQKRLEAMLPFCYPTDASRRGLKGTALLRFQLDPLGYPFVMQQLTSTGHAILDAQLETLLHLAEPYPYVEGWVVVPVTFPPAAETPPAR